MNLTDCLDQLDFSLEGLQVESAEEVNDLILQNLMAIDQKLDAIVQEVEQAGGKVERMNQVNEQELLQGVETAAAEDAKWHDWSPTITGTGVIKGAPEWVNSEADLQKLYELGNQLINEGVTGRYWYEESARKVLEMMQGDVVQAEKFIQLLAIYSPQATVNVNTTFALRAWNQWKAGKPIDVKTGNQDEKATDVLYNDLPFDGRKTNSFYLNLMHDIVAMPGALDQLKLEPDLVEEIDKPATIDLWMYRAYGYENFQAGDDKGTGKYSFSENVTRKLAADLNRTLMPGEDRWTPHQVQAAIWSAMKARFELPYVKEETWLESLEKGYAFINEKGERTAPTSKDARREHDKIWRRNAMAANSQSAIYAADVSSASFETYLDMLTEMITWEAMPSKDLGHAILNADPETKRRFTIAAKQLLLTDDGADMLAEKLGAPLAFITDGTGAYEGDISPNNISHILPNKPAGEYSRSEVQAYAQAIQYIFMQDAVPWYRADNLSLTSATAREQQMFKVVNAETGRMVPKSRSDDQASLDELAAARNAKELKTQKRKKRIADLEQQLADRKAKPAETKEEKQQKEQEVAELEKTLATAKNPFQVRGGKYARAVSLQFNKDISGDSATQLLDLLQGVFGEGAGFTQVSPNEIHLVNFRDGETGVPFLNDDVFFEQFDQVKKDLDKMGLAEAKHFYSEGEYGYEHNWEKEKTGDAILDQGGLAGRPDLQAWIRGRRKAFEQLLEDFDQGQQAGLELFQSGPGAGTVNQVAPFDTTVQPKLVKTVPLSQIQGADKAHAADKATKFLRATAEGKGPARRAPSVREEADGTYTVLDGRSGTSAALNLGYDQIPVRVIDSVAPYLDDNGQELPSTFEDEGAQQQFDKLYGINARVKDKFDKVAEGIVEELGFGVTVLPGLKGRDSAVRKINKKYEGDPRAIKDVLRGTIFVRSEMEARQVHELIMDRYNVRVAETNLTDGTPIAMGYMDNSYDILMTDKNGDQVIAELQLNTGEMAMAKMTFGHLYYEDARVLDIESTANPVHQAAYQSIGAASEELYNKARAMSGQGLSMQSIEDQLREVAQRNYANLTAAGYAPFLNKSSAIDKNFSLEILRPLFNTPNSGGTGSKSPDLRAQNSAPEGEIAAGTPSSSQNDQSSPTSSNRINNTSDGSIPQYSQEARGSIAFLEQGAVIRLFEAANPSTFLHESAHLFLQIYLELGTPETQAILDWLGADSVDDVLVKRGRQPTDRQRHFHEKFARGFEAYLREGKAPESSLRGVFARFKGWLLQVYKSVSQLNVELDDSIRGVMDRMVATDEAIKQAKQEAELMAMFTSAEEMGVTEREYQDYVQALAQGTDLAQEQVDKQTMAKLKREAQEGWRAERAKIQASIEDEMSKEKRYQAQRALIAADPKDKLAMSDLEALYGSDGFWRTKWFGNNAIWSKEGTANPDEAAATFGYSTVDEMIQDMYQAPNLRAAAKEQATAQMRERYGDPDDYNAIAQAAMEKLQNNRIGNFLAVELKAIEKRAGVDPTLRSVLKRTAERIVGEQKARDVKPYRYYQTMLKQARMAQDFVSKEQYQEAAEAKRRQLLNHYLYREALKAQQFADSTRKYVARLQSKGTRENIPPDYLDRIDQILEAYNFKPQSLKSIDRDTSLVQWIEEQRDAGNEVVVPEDIIERRKHYKNLTIDELRGVRDALTNLHHLAKLKNRLLVAREKAEYNERVDKLISLAEESGLWSEIDLESKHGVLQKLGGLIDVIDAEHIKPEFLFSELDGGELGLWWQTMFEPLALAESNEAKMQEEAAVTIRDIFAVYSNKEKRDNESVLLNTTALLGRRLTKNEVMALALNWGNRQNREAVLDGEKTWTEDGVNSVLNSVLTDKDWDVVQSIWDHINTYWSDISALQKEMSGVVPEKVSADNFELASGRVMQGGYYPLKYDPDRKLSQLVHDQKQQVKDMYGGNAFRAATRQGHTKERVGSGGAPVQLTLGVYTDHVNNVIHDLTHRAAIGQVDRLLNDQRVTNAIDSTFGKEARKRLKPWLQSIASEPIIQKSFMDSWIAGLRKNTTIVNMGWKVTTAIVQPLGYLQTVEHLGAKYSTIGLRQAYGSPTELVAKWEMIKDKSPMMKNRVRTFDRDVRDAVTRIKGDTLKDTIERTYFNHIGYMDLMVSIPSWLGGYQKAKDSNPNGTEAEWVAEADSAVRMSQSAGGVKDLAHIQQGGTGKRAFTMFYSYFNVLYNLMRRSGVRIKKDESYAGKILQFMSSSALLLALPAVLSELIVGRYPEEDEDPLVWAAIKTGVYPAMTVVGVRDFANAFTTPFGYSPTPLVDAAELISRMPGAIGDVAMGEGNKADARTLTLGLGYILGIPARQLFTTLDHIYEVGTGEDEPNLPELLYRDNRD